MTAYPESNQIIEHKPAAGLSRPELPGGFAWKVCRSLARFVGSVFFPYFRVWGETDLQRGGQIFITRNYGLQTWLTALRVFKRPVRVVLADQTGNQRWFNLAEKNGLAPMRLTGGSDQNFLTLEHLAEAGEKLLLVVPQLSDASIDLLVSRLRATRSLRVLFMAISGARESLPEKALVPRAVPISVFCGLPHYVGSPGDSPLAELNFLEQALKDLAIDEIPSIFSNHPRNLNRIQSV